MEFTLQLKRSLAEKSLRTPELVDIEEVKLDVRFITGS